MLGLFSLEMIGAGQAEAWGYATVCARAAADKNQDCVESLLEEYN